MSERTPQDVLTPIHDVERRWTGGTPPDGRSPGLSIDVRMVDVATIFGDWDAVPVVQGDGSVGVILRQRGIHPEGDGTWGCATCEQCHPIGVKSCPLVGRLTVRVAIGPIYHDGDQVLYLGAEVAKGSFEHGRMHNGLAVWRLR